MEKEEAMKILRELHDKALFSERTALETFVPELKESEDKMIREYLIRYIDNTMKSSELKSKLLAWLEKQGGQNSTYILDNSASNIKFPFKAKVKSNGKIVTIHSGQLSIDCKEWIKYQSDVKDGYTVYEPEENVSIWSEEDLKMLDSAISFVNLSSFTTIGKGKNNTLAWLKSLKARVHPQNHWKPNEEQMKALHDLNLTGDISYAGQGQVLIELYNDLNKLKGE